MSRRSRGKREPDGKIQKSRGKDILGQLYSESREKNILEIVGSGYPVACPLPISTRGIGFMITRMVKILKQKNPRRMETMPDLSTIYRASLAQLEAKMMQSNLFQSSAGTLNFASRYDDISMPYERCKIIEIRRHNLSGVALIINSIGIFEYEGKKFVPVFLKKLSPLNLRITNLREYCVKMADLTTDAEFRMSGYQLNSIPGATWKREDENDPSSVYLDNPNEIIPEIYDDTHLRTDLMELGNWLSSISLSSSPGVASIINYKGDGKSSLLASTQVTPENTLRIENELIKGDQNGFRSAYAIDDNNWCIGVVGLMGEVSNPMDSGCRLSINRASIFSSWFQLVDMFIQKNLQVNVLTSYEQTGGSSSSMDETLKITWSPGTLTRILSLTNPKCQLEISTRGIGFILASVTEKIKSFYPKLVNEIPISAMYRASLAQLEAKIHFNMPKCVEITLLVAKMIRRFPTNCSQIVFLINKVGNITYQGICFEPIFAKETSPLNLRITNLRKYCVEMADPNTDPAKRVAGFELNSIPNAKWARQNDDDPNSIILTNPDEIIPNDYKICDDLGDDLMKTSWFLQRISIKGMPNCYDSIDFRANGDPGIIISTDAVSGECPRLNENNKIVNGYIQKEFWSSEYLDCYSWYVGATSLVGEIYNTPIAGHRSQNFAAKQNDLAWKELFDLLLH